MSLQKHITALKASKVAAIKPAVEDLDAGAVNQGPVGTVMIEPMPDHLQELRDTYERLEKDSDEHVAAEVSDTAKGLKEVKSSLESSNLTGGISAESACFAAMAIESYSSRLGIDSETLTGSLESAITNPTSNTVISTDELTASIEAVDHGGKQFLKKMSSTFFRLVSPRWTRVKIAGSTLTLIIAGGRRTKAVKGLTIDVPARYISLGDTYSKNVALDLQKAATQLAYLVKDFTKEAGDDFSANCGIVDAAFEGINDYSAIDAALRTIYGKWRDPRRKLGSKASEPMIGNYQVFEDHSLKYKGESEIAKKFDILANHDYPTLGGFQKSANAGDSDSGKITIPALTPEEVASIGLSLKHAVDSYRFWKAATQKLSAATTVLTATGGLALAIPSIAFPPMPIFAAWASLVILKGARRAVQSNDYEARDLHALHDALDTSSRMRFHVGYDAGAVLLKMIDLYKYLATRSLKVQGKVAVESMDQASAIVGVTVNETALVEPIMQPVSGDTAPVGEVLPKKDSIQDLAVMKQDLSGPVDENKADAELAAMKKDQDIDVPAPRQSGGPGLESLPKPAQGKAVPYWYRPK